MLAIVLAWVLAMGCGDLCGPQALWHYERLFAEAGYGRMPHERGGFLIRETDGTLTFAPWSVSAFARASFHGRIPANALAVVHTHPSSMSPKPSTRDVAEARRIGLPVLVVAREGVTIARPDGSIAQLSGPPASSPAGRAPSRRPSAAGRRRASRRDGGVPLARRER